MVYRKGQRTNKHFAAACAFAVDIPILGGGLGRTWTMSLPRREPFRSSTRGCGSNRPEVILGQSHAPAKPCKPRRGLILDPRPCFVCRLEGAPDGEHRRNRIRFDHDLVSAVVGFAYPERRISVVVGRKGIGGRHDRHQTVADK